MRLYIIRHGQSTNNALEDQTHRVHDPLLSDLGFKQAQMLSDYLEQGVHSEQRTGESAEDTGVRTVKGYGVTRLYCSAMHRALLTALPIGKALNLNPEVWVDIHEGGGIFLDYHDDRGIVGFPGKTRGKILQEFPHYILPSDVTDGGWWDVNRGMEDTPECLGRAIRVARQLRLWADTDEHIAIVSHAGFLNVLIKALVNQLPGPDLTYHHSNTAMTCIDFKPDQKIGIRYLNRVDHLSQDTVS
ncbi:MAG: histidine phosphatase family protein [Spirochaetales bacterium]|jgi:2,3-bisphosphoglycerate-dependent phosphoglycerate mutase|nr:histidine phosphatase family protein [Spirochaetales bacterium]